MAVRMLAEVAGQARPMALSAILGAGALTGSAMAQDGGKPAEKPAETPVQQPAQPTEEGKPATPPSTGNPELDAQIKRLQEEAAKRGINFTPPKVGQGQPSPAAGPQPAPQPVPQPVPTPAAAQKPGPAPAEKGKAEDGKGNSTKVEGGKGSAAPDGKQGGAMPAPSSTPAAAHEGAEAEPAVPVHVPEGMVRLEFTDAVEVLQLVKFVRETLDLQVIVMDGGLAGQKVTFTDPMVFPKDRLLKFLVGVLESKDYTIVENEVGLYVVQPRQQIQAAIGKGEFMTTRVIRTPNMRPTQLQTVITNLLAGSRGPAAGPGSAPTYLDDLGVIILTDTPRVTGLVQSLVDTLVEERAQLKFARFELNHIAATSARDRVLELMGQAAQRIQAGVVQPGQPAQPVMAAPGQTILNISERMTVDPSSNALMFRGRPDETAMLADLLSIVDVPNSLVSRFYPVGLSTAEAVANAGSKEQLGGVTTFESSGGGGRGTGRVGTNPAQPGLSTFGGQGGDFMGAGFVLYPEAGGFIYRGTPAQHERVQSLITGLKDLSERDRVVIEFYKLKHGKAEDVAGVIQNLLTNSTPSGNRGLVGRDIGGANRNRTQNRTNTAQPAAAQQAAAGGEGPGLGEINGDEVFVIADEGNNQVVVKAPAKLQPQFKQLIQRIDLRRPQVYLDAKIMVVTSTEGLDVTTEVQQIIGQFAFNTNFGLGSLTSTTGSGDSATTTGGLRSRKNPAANLSGLTTALIRSKDVPFLINALARNVDGRVVATPQLLVDDNSEAEIKSKDQQPTSTTSQSGQAGSTVTGFGGFEEAGPSLKVKPQIADGGYLRLEYEIELSSFTGSPSGGLPSPKQTNNIKSESVTVPTDTTIVVGGLVSENQGKTVLKIPLLGDIPIVGELFKDTSITKTKTTLFVFITPKIMRDPTFADLRLLTSKPLVNLDLPSELPPPEPVRIDVIDTATIQTREREKDDQAENKRRETSEPKKRTKSDTDPWN